MLWLRTIVDGLQLYEKKYLVNTHFFCQEALILWNFHTGANSQVVGIGSGREEEHEVIEEK